MPMFGECALTGCTCKSWSGSSWANSFKAIPNPQTHDGSKWQPPGWVLRTGLKKLCGKHYSEFNSIWDAAADKRASRSGQPPLPRPSKGASSKGGNSSNSERIALSQSDDTLQDQQDVTSMQIANDMAFLEEQNALLLGAGSVRESTPQLPPAFEAEEEEQQEKEEEEEEEEAINAYASDLDFDAGAADIENDSGEEEGVRPGEG